MNKTVAETMYANIETVGLPTWSEADQTLAKALQKELKVPEIGLATKINPLRGREVDSRRGEARRRLRRHRRRLVERADGDAGYPVEHPGRPGPQLGERDRDGDADRAQGRAVAGAKVQAMTVLDLLTRPELVTQAWDYFNNVQTKDVKYMPFIRPEDKPAIWLNKDDDGQVPAGDEEVLLRPDQVQDLPRSARHQVSDGAARRRRAAGIEQ